MLLIAAMNHLLLPNKRSFCEKGAEIRAALNSMNNQLQLRDPCKKKSNRIFFVTSKSFKMFRKEDENNV